MAAFKEVVTAGLVLSILLMFVCARMPHYKGLTDQKQVCVSEGQCVHWPHPHSALGYSVWA